MKGGTILETLPSRLKNLRKEKNVMQKEIASFLDVSSSAYGFYEQGKRTPTSDIIGKLADYFNVSTDYLLCKTNIKKQPIDNREFQEKDIEKMIDELMEQQGLMLCGEPMSDTDMMLLRNSIRNTIELAKSMRNKK
jgi:transcriptional regulator with XRE-family HTH domain